MSEQSNMGVAPSQTRAPGASPFLVELIKPSHYDDDGYVVQWWKSLIPSNSLAVLYGLSLDAAQSKLLGDEVEIRVAAYDETNTRVPLGKIIRRFRRNSNRGIACLVGVQSNQFPRALDIARQLRAEGIPVAMGGFHVSGCLSMLPELPPELQEAMNLGVTLFAGEAEGKLPDLLRDAHENRLEPLYNFLADLPDLQGAPFPHLRGAHVRRYMRHLGCFDAGRGCPFACSFCTIINVQGRKSRFRDADDIEQIVRAYHREGIDSFFITDDNFARNSNWRAIFDRLIRLREEEGIAVYFVIQVDTMSHRIAGFVERAYRAGCRFAFIGLENINPENLAAVAKRQNRVGDYRRMLQAWKNAGVITYCGYILGFPADTPERIRRDIQTIQRELPVDILEFFMLTPLPGSQDHRELHLKGTWMEPDLNKYELEHVTTHHPRMTRQEWEGAYADAWHQYYSWPHIETLIRRALATKINAPRLVALVFEFYGSYRFEKLHPLQCGFFRRKGRRQKRHGHPIESVWRYYPHRLWELLATYVPASFFLARLLFLWWRLSRNPGARQYTDIAIAPGDESSELQREAVPVADAAAAAAAE